MISEENVINNELSRLLPSNMELVDEKGNRCKFLELIEMNIVHARTFVRE